MIDVSPVSSITEFERFRFMRGEFGELAEILSSNRTERLFLVLDCQRFRVARLHIFENDSADESASPERFKREMRALSSLRQPGLSPIFCFGQDETELYYASSVVDGESLEDFVRRTGPMPAADALRLALQLIDLLASRPVLPRALENFSPGDLFVESAGAGALTLVFANYSGWRREEVSSPSDLVERAALLLYSLLAGEFFETAPYILFNEEAHGTPEPLRELVKVALKKKTDAAPINSLQAFGDAARRICLFLEDSPEIASPKRFLRDWLLEGEDSVKLGADYRLLHDHGRNGSPEITENSAFAFDAEPTATVSFNGVRFQLFPSENSIPREGWLDQHRCAIRHPGRGRSNQLRVTALIPHGRCLLIGEERIESLNLEAVVEQHGPLEIRHALELGNKLNSALDSIERTVGASPIWWLPPENTHIVTGPGGIAALREALNRYGTRAWHHLPIRLQLHQTIPSLLTGVDLPESLLRRMRTGLKNGDAARRSAVLLPLLCFAITGQLFRWDQPLEPVEGIPQEIIDLLEKTRATLVDDPSRENGRLLDRIASTLAGEPIPAFLLPELDAPLPSEDIIVDSSLSSYETATFDFQKPRARKEGVNARVAGLMDRSGDNFPAFQPRPREEITGKEGMAKEDGYTDETQPIPAVSDEVPEIESLGLIEDESVREFETETSSEKDFTDEAQPIPSASEEAPEIESLGLIEDELVREFETETFSEKDFTDEAQPISSASEEAPEIESLGLIEDESVREFETETSSEKDFSDETQPISSAPEIESLGLIEDESVREFETETSREVDSSDETQPIPAAAEEATEIDSLGPIEDESLGESEPETSDGDDLNSEDPAESDLNPEPEASDSVPVSAAEGFGERLLTRVGNSIPRTDSKPVRESESPDRPRSSWGKVISLALCICGATLGIALGIGGIASWANRQALSEDFFQSTRYPDMKTTRPVESVTPAAIPSDFAEPATLKFAEAANADEAIRRAGESLKSKSYSDAVSYFLRALALQPDSSEARSQLGKAIETWSQADDFPVTAGQESPRLEDEQKELVPHATRLLAEYHRPRDLATHLHWLTRSANSGYAPHQRELGLIFSRVPHEMKTAAEWLRKAADAGDSDAQFHYGECLVFGKGVPKNVNLAIEAYLSKAIEAGDGRAMELLGVCYAKGDGVNADPFRAHDYFQQAVEAGNREAYYNLAVRYAKGDGVSKSAAEAARIFREGAEQGDAACMYAFGRCLETGFGIAKNPAGAADWIRKSALLDFDDARAWCGNHGVLLANKSAS